MNIRRFHAALVALTLACAGALSACSTGDRSGDADTSARGGDQAITTAWEAEFSAYNNNTAEQNGSKNDIILNQVLRGFWSYGADGSIAPDLEFGTVTKTGDAPLSVHYAIHPDAAWSDGDPIDCNDFLLTWAANSGAYPSGAKDETGTDVPLFSSSGTTGYAAMAKPQCAPGDKDIEVTYAEPFADWQAMFGAGSILPAHIVEQKAGVANLVAAIADDDLPQLTKAAEFYNTGWTFTPGGLPKDAIPSAGPYTIRSWEAGESITLEANDKWWGTPAKTKTVVVRFIAPEQQAQALANGEVQVIAPQAQVDVVEHLERLGGSVKVLSGDKYTYEHLDLNVAGAFADPALRRAFALCVPRQLIVDNLVKPVNPDAQILNSRYAYPFQDSYADVASTVTDGSYDTVDVAAARELLEAAGKTGMTVRIGYNSPNPRREAQVELIRDSCNQAGFDIQDAGAPDFFDTSIADGNFDVALFAWSASPLVSDSASTFTTGGGLNVGGYSNPRVDDLVRQLGQAADPAAQTELVKQIDKILWDDVVTVPLFSHPGLVAHAADVQGVTVQPSQSDLTWNMQEWTVNR